MAYGTVLKILGYILLGEALLMTPSLGISLFFGEADAMPFVWAIGITLLVGLAGVLIKPDNKLMRYREGFLIVTAGWFLVSVFGGLPFLFNGSVPHFVDAFFETASGFSTTGASILTDIEAQPHGILFWRSFTHWLGGMGILVFTLAFLPALGGGTMQIFRAESPGPTPERLVPRIQHTAMILYAIYTAITAMEIIALKIAGLSWFDSFTHSFATMGTGGFSTQNASVGAYTNPAVHWIIIVFMFLAGANFALYFSVIRGRAKTMFQDSEFRFYSLVVVGSVVLIALNIMNLPGYGAGHVEKTIRDAAFQTLSIITTTGFATVNYEFWPDFSKLLIIILMFIGGSSGSTGGSIKCIRVLLVLKYIKREFLNLIHPKAVIPIRLGKNVIAREVMSSVMGLVMLYMFIFIVTSLFLLTQGMDLMSSTSATIACLGNIGPGFGMVGPAMNYAALTSLSKIVLSFAMILGRLEVYTVLVIFMPSFWRD